MLADLLLSLRNLARQRAFTAVTVLTLSLGIGCAAAIFSVTDWILFSAKTFPEDVVLIGGKSGTANTMPIRFDYQARAYEEQSNLLTQFAKAAYMTGNVVIDGTPVRTGWMGISPTAFPLLGVTILKGRAFVAGEDVEGKDSAVIISKNFWQTSFGGREDILGQKLTVGTSVCEVVGVVDAARNFPAYMIHDVYRPLAYHPNPAQPWDPALFVLAKLRPGVTREQATAALAAIPLAHPQALAQFMNEDRPVLSSMKEVNKAMRKDVYWVMAGAVGFLYAISCLNASNLILLRLLGRQRDLCIRLALGCGRWRLVRLLWVESVSLSLFGAFGGFLVAKLLFPVLLSAADTGSSGTLFDSWTLSSRGLVLLSGLTVFTSFLIVVLPALRVFRVAPYEGIKEGGAMLGESPRLARIRGIFVVLQVCFSMILLVGAGLMISTFQKLRNIPVGFDILNHAKVTINFPPDYPGTSDERLARLYEVRDHLKKTPGILEAGFGNDMLLSGWAFQNTTLASPEGKPVKAAMLFFNRGYQDASGIQLKRGAWLEKSNGNDILVNETLARTFWPNQEPVGQFLKTIDGNPSAGKDWKGWLVVGVVGDFRSTMRDSTGPTMFGPESWGAQSSNSFILKLTKECDDAFASVIRKDLYAYDSRLIVDQVRPMAALRDNLLWVERLADSVLKVLAAVAVLLTAVGIFSVIAFTVDRRKAEFGVRMALGASPENILTLVLRRGLWLALTGVVTGTGGALLLSRYVQSLLYETSPQDPWVLAIVVCSLLFVALLACLVPAFRAGRLDVSHLLRTQ